MGELSRGVRGVVFVFDLLMNFKFVFSHLDTFGDHPLGQRPSLGLRLGPVCGRLPGSLSLGPSSDPLLDPPSKVTHFLLTALHRTATFGPDPAGPSFDLVQTPLGTDLGCVPLEPKHIAKPQCLSEF